MKKITFLLPVVFIMFLLTRSHVQASEIAAGSATLNNNDFRFDIRVERLHDFLDYYNSPLVNQAEVFIRAADRYQIDWKLIPAISGVESSFGKQIPRDSYNAYGWNNGSYRFESWEDSIEHVSRYLAEKYIARGLDNPYKIGPVYAPPSPDWAGKVIYFMKQIESQSARIEDLELTI